AVPGEEPLWIVADDFNGDGHVDMALADGVDNHEVSVVFGRGDGTFGDERRYAVGKGPLEMVEGDFNGDGHADLAVQNYDGQDISVLFGRGDGTFQDELRLPAGGAYFLNGLAAGDVNGDGLDDLISATNAAYVHLGRRDGTFAPAVPYFNNFAVNSTKFP